MLTYEAIKTTGCDSGGDDNGSSCSTNGDDDDDDGSEDNCRRLWGLIKSDSLLTVIATAAGIVLALSSMFVGTAMEVTPYRRQIGQIGTTMCVVGMALCLAIIVPNPATIAVCSVGLMVLYIFKDYHYIVIESYMAEMTHVPKEMATMLSVGSIWFYSTEVFMVILWVIVGFFVDGALYGFVVTVASVVLVGGIIPIAYGRLPDVPTMHALQSTQSLITYTLHRQKTLFLEVYNKYPDYGIVIVANMVYDAGLSAIFVAAVQILVSKFHFTASEIPIILGIAIISAIVGAYISRCIVKIRCQGRSSLDVWKGSVGDMEEAHVAVAVEGGAGGGKMGVVSVPQETQIEGVYSAVFSSNVDEITKEMCVQPRKMQISIIMGLLAVTVVTVCGTYMMQPCNLGLACIFGVLWGCTMSFCWTCSNMLRSSLVPGGLEAEFAGLLLTTTNATSWIPLMVFSVANEVWTIEGAMLTLLPFFIVGGLILSTINMNRAVTTVYESLSQRRWANTQSRDWMANKGVAQSIIPPSEVGMVPTN